MRQALLSRIRHPEIDLGVDLVGQRIKRIAQAILVRSPVEVRGVVAWKTFSAQFQ